MAFEYTKQERAMIAQNSMERITNTAIRNYERIAMKRRLCEDEEINYQDLLELKDLMAKVWNDKRNQFFREG